MPSDDSDSPLERAEACVTCPTSFEPLGITVLPSDLTASVLCAFTGSPGLHFFESIGELSAALNAVPVASEPFACPFCADAEEGVAALPDGRAALCVAGSYALPSPPIGEPTARAKTPASKSFFENSNAFAASPT